MATLSRRPLASRPPPLQVPSILSPLKTTRTASCSTKRSRSPDLAGDGNASNTSTKRARAVADYAATATRDKDKERRHTEREQQKTEFKEKYCRAFPTWTFYFDSDNVEVDSAVVKGILELGGRIEDFFSNAITHLITNHTVPTTFTVDIAADKENVPKSKASLSRPAALLRSPIKLKGRTAEDAGVAHGYDLVTKAIGFGMKIWTTTKLNSVLERCIDAPAASTSTDSRAASLVVPSTTANSHQRSLMRLLQSERLHGTSERDPTQKRHDFQYFSRSSCFVLIEDMRQELAIIAAQEYPIPKGREEAGKVPWPVLHCHPHSRGPFIAFDEREKKRWEKMQRAEREKESEREERRIKMMRAEEVKRRAEAHLHTRNGDLRRSVSMNNLHRRVTRPDSVFRGARMVDLDDTCDNPDSANASGYLASGTGGGHIAASGNSVGITSTTGTTSTAGQSLRSLQLPAALRGRIQHQVMTSRKFSSVAADKAQGNQRVAGKMGPPVKIPERPQMLRKSRSTNTLKLPKREEGSKPGYCESCRTKFDDFQAHIIGRKHRKFAMDDTNFLQLDYVLRRVKRRTVREVDDEQRERETRRKEHDVDRDEGPDGMFYPQSPQDQTIRQEVWEGDIEMDREGYVDLDND